MAIYIVNGLSLTSMQLKCLKTLDDGEWHDRNEIRQKMGLKTFHSNISSRLTGPLVNDGLLEQEKRPLKEGSKKMKAFVRVTNRGEDLVGTLGLGFWATFLK